MNAGARQDGFSYVEIMVAVLLLAICAVPMADAIRNGLMASNVGMDKVRELRCMKNTMEIILAEPYQTLWEVAAAPENDPVAYALPTDAACDGVGRTLDIVLCEQCGEVPVPLTTTDTERRASAMLFITLTSDHGYSFKTLVAR